MQHALKHVERPGGSHKALDGKKASLAGGFTGRLAGLCVVWFVVICLHFRTLQIDVLLLMLMKSCHQESGDDII